MPSRARRKLTVLPIPTAAPVTNAVFAIKLFLP
jgi:hypothetical protein